MQKRLDNLCDHPVALAGTGEFSVILISEAYHNRFGVPQKEDDMVFRERVLNSVPLFSFLVRIPNSFKGNVVTATNSPNCQGLDKIEKRNDLLALSGEFGRDDALPPLVAEQPSIHGLGTYPSIKRRL